MKELLSEVWISIRANRKRLFLTGLAVGWGMFILVVLLGSTTGLRKGVINSFHIDMPQMASVVCGEISIPWKGRPRNSMVELFPEDAEALQNSGIRHIDEVFPIVSQPGLLVYGGEHSNVPVTGCPPGYINAIYERISEGRDINRPDIDERKNVLVINSMLAKQFFKESSAEGRTVRLNGTPFTIIGVCRSLFVEDTYPMCFCPVSTALSHYRPKGDVDVIYIKSSGIRTFGTNRAFIRDLRNFIAGSKNFCPDDNKALQVNNDNDYFILGYGVLDSLAIFIWLLGLATLFAGIVGVSNIMLVAVKERTKEFGIRMAMGAPDREITKLVITESLIVVFVFGYLGIMVGVLLLQLVSNAVGDSVDMFREPSVGFWTVIAGNLILTAAGALAGYVPAKKAVGLKLVDALK